MTDDYASTIISETDREVVLQAIATIREKLPLLVDTQEAWNYLQNHDQKNRELTSKALEVAMQNPNFQSRSNPVYKRQTLQEILKQRQKSSFVGREEEIALFRHNLKLPFADSQHRFIFNISGQGGVGKSSLLRQFRQIAENANVLTAYTDEFATSTAAVMNCLAQQLEQQGYKFTKFTERYQFYYQKQKELATDPDAPQGFSAFLRRIVPKTEVNLQLPIPGTAVVLEYVDKDTGMMQTDWVSYVAKKVANKDDLRLLQEPIAVLTPLFLEDLWQVAENSDIALFFDTYDRTQTFLDRWLREILAGQYGDVPSNILLAIAGRQELSHNEWTCYEGSIARLHLEPFTDNEVKQFLSLKGISDPQIIEMILRLSERLPLLVAMLSFDIPDDTSQLSDANGMIIERFLKLIKEPKRRQDVLTAAIPRYLHRDILTVLRGEQEAEEILDWLKQMPFLEARPHGWVYHDVAKTLILRYKRLSSASSWTELQSKLAYHYDSLASELQLEERKQWCNPTWQSHKLNALYHRLCQSPQKNLTFALNQFMAALQHQYSFAVDWAETMMQVGKDADAVEVQRWGEKLLKGLQALEKEEYEATAEMLTTLIEQGKMDAEWRALAFNYRGAIYYMGKRYDEALKSLKQATNTDSNLESASILRGLIYIERERYLEAIKNFEQVIAQNPENVEAIAQRGYTYNLIKRYEEAIQDFNRVIALDCNYIWARMQRGHSNLLMQNYAEAVQDFDCILAIDPEYSKAFALRGTTHQLMECYAEAIKDFDRFLAFEPYHLKINILRGATYYLLKRYPQATQDFNRVLDRDSHHIPTLVLRGMTYRAMDYHVEAIEDFDHVIVLNPDNKWVILQRGETYSQIEDYSKALQDFEQAIALDSQDTWAITSRGETYLLMGYYEQALKDFNRAIEIDANYMRAITSRGEIYQLMRRYDDALQDFDRILEIAPHCTEAMSNRGETYQLMGLYEKALQDFNQAIELQPQDSWLIASRGETYQLMGHYDEALKDFDQALNLDPNYTWAIACRGETYQLMGHYDEALKEFDRALELDPANDRALAARGYAYWMVNSYKEALQDFERAIELNPSNGRPWVGRGYTYRAMNRYTAALKDFDCALELDSNNGWALAGRGATYCRMQRNDEALKDFDHALALTCKHHYEWAFAGRSYTYLLLKRYDEALADANRAVELNPKSEWYLYLRALAAQTLNQASNARADLALAIKVAKERYQKNPQNWRNTFNLALYYLAVQYYPTVESLYKYAMSKGASLEHIREAIHDLDDFLIVFPEHLQAKSMRQLLQSALN